MKSLLIGHLIRLQQVIFLCCLSGIAVSQHGQLFDSESNHGFHSPHHLSVLNGDTYVSGEGNNATIGIDYEYRVNDFLGLGAVIEKAYGELDAVTVLAVADLHLYKGFIAQVGPGFERRHSENVAVARIGFLYEFELAKFTLSPQLHWDYHDGETNALVAGMALGFSF